MIKNIIQIENVEATEILSRLDRMESALGALKGTPHTQATTSDALADYITRRELAGVFKISLPTIHDWTKKGLLQAYKVGNRVYYKRSEAESAMVKKGGCYAR